jgi:hypothetical protein
MITSSSAVIGSIVFTFSNLACVSQKESELCFGGALFILLQDYVKVSIVFTSCRDLEKMNTNSVNAI